MNFYDEDGGDRFLVKVCITYKTARCHNPGGRNAQEICVGKNFRRPITRVHLFHPKSLTFKIFMSFSCMEKLGYVQDTSDNLNYNMA
jgi:hypothetical protein